MSHSVDMGAPAVFAKANQARIWSLFAIFFFFFWLMFWSSDMLLMTDVYR